MRLHIVALASALAVAGLLALVACDRTQQPDKAAASTRTLAELDAAVKRLEQDAAGRRWVLWRSTTLLDAAQFSLPIFAQEGFATKAQCEDGMRARIAENAQPYPVTKTSYQVIEQRLGRVVYTFYCLPDTVDPRQPQPIPAR